MLVDAKDLAGTPELEVDLGEFEAGVEFGEGA